MGAAVGAGQQTRGCGAIDEQDRGENETADNADRAKREAEDEEHNAKQLHGAAFTYKGGCFFDGRCFGIHDQILLMLVCAWDRQILSRKIKRGNISQPNLFDILPL